MSLKNKILICMLAIIIIGAVGCSNETEKIKEEIKEEGAIDYTPTIMWQDTLYSVEDIKYISATKEQLDEKIGEIENVVDVPTTNNTASMFEKGSNIYSLKGKRVKKMIAIEYQGKYYIAVKMDE
ncbi:hypothetical protein [Abyssisolibacter fermentans]|uniref:hypothetical protein n=1 Tax=Abyssisolibacter fermentans TaxID=1766203 RepID=UPI00083379DC|nr:hypothetical protein [Abyssisolibacter fermentans]